MKKIEKNKAPKKAYSPPKVIDYGDVARITLMGSTSGGGDLNHQS